ncbi:MAG TPA: sugar-binding transcriptional regulator [Chloroflexota bacterium]|nr:sugar-binding transcriptional regulator [Chloroflexota bacterium]
MKLASSGPARMAPGNEASRGRLTAVARMYYLDGLGQHEIAEILGISRSQISRLLTRARELGIVRISVDDYDPRDRELESRLLGAFGLRHAVVIRTAERGVAQVRRTTGYFAAPAVAELIRPGMTVGLAGGRTLAAVVEYLVPCPGVRGLVAVQLMGNIGPAASEIDAVELSRVLAQRFVGAFYTINAPAIAQDRSARDLFLAHDHIRTVWQLFDSLQLALVGIGSLQESAFIERGVLSAAERGELSRAGAVGEICGRYYDSHGRECHTALRDRVIGIDLDTLRRGPDVVAITNGRTRAPAVRAALEGGLITSLVIDDGGAEALLALKGTR